MFIKRTSDRFILTHTGPAYEGTTIESYDDPLVLAQYMIRYFGWKERGGEELRKFLEGELRALDEE